MFPRKSLLRPVHESPNLQQGAFHEMKADLEYEISQLKAELEGYRSKEEATKQESREMSQETVTSLEVCQMC